MSVDQVLRPALSERRQIIQDSTRYLVATVTGQGIGLLRAVMIPVLLGPTQLGIWNLMTVILSYGNHAQLGVLHGLNKLVPMLRGQGQSDQITSVRNSVFWTNLILAAMAACGVGLVSFFTPSLYGKALRIEAVIILLSLIYCYLFSLLRADNCFSLLSTGVAGFSVLSTVLILTCGFIFADRLSGALIGLASAYALTVLYWQSMGGYHYAFKINRSAIHLTFSLGIPLIILGVLDAVLLSVDRWVIAARLGETQLGYYALGIMACNMISQIPGSIASVLYSRMLEGFGASGEPMSLRGLLIGPTRALVAFMAILIGGAVVILPFIIRFFLPKYASSIPVLTILIPGAFFYAMTFIPGSFVTAINQQHKLIAIQGVCVGLGLILSMVAVSMGWGIVGVALSTFMVYVTYGLGYIIIASKFTFRAHVDCRRFLSQVLTPFGALVLALALGMLIIPVSANLGDETVHMIERLALMAVILLLALWWTNRDGEVMAVIKEEFYELLSIRALNR